MLLAALLIMCRARDANPAAYARQMRGRPQAGTDEQRAPGRFRAPCAGGGGQSPRSTPVARDAERRDRPPPGRGGWRAGPRHRADAAPARVGPACCRAYSSTTPARRPGSSGRGPASSTTHRPLSPTSRPSSPATLSRAGPPTRCRSPSPSIVTDTFAHGRGTRLRWVTAFDAAVLAAASPPRMRVEDAALRVASRRAGALDAVQDLAGPVQARLTTPPRISDALVRHPKLRRRAWIADVLDDLAHGSWSVLEHGYLVRVERQHGLPVGIRQHRASVGGRSVYRDVDYAPYGVFVELDGSVARNRGPAPPRPRARPRCCCQRTIHRPAGLGPGLRHRLCDGGTGRSAAAEPRVVRRPSAVWRQLHHRLMASPSLRGSRRARDSADPYSTSRAWRLTSL